MRLSRPIDPAEICGNPYSILLCAWSEPGAAVTGDVDGNAIIDLQDRDLILDHLLGRVALSAGPLADADINGDGLVDSADIRRMGQLSLLPSPTLELNSASPVLFTPADVVTITGTVTTSLGDLAGLGAAFNANNDEDANIPVILDKFIYEPVMPYTRADDTAYAAPFDARLSLRLRADDAIDIASLWADISGYGAPEVRRA